MNNFKDYGFEADFSGEILRKTKHNIYIGYIVDGKDIEYAIEWNCKGDNLLSSRFNKNYNLKPIKKEWYENIDSFPCILINTKTNKPHIAYSYNDIENKIKMETFSCNPNKFRLATDKEVDNLKLNK